MLTLKSKFKILIDVLSFFTIVSTKYAFAALTNEGNVITWGDKDYGGNSNKVSHLLKNVETIYCNEKNFTAHTHEGDVTW